MLAILAHAGLRANRLTATLLCPLDTPGWRESFVRLAQKRRGPPEIWVDPFIEIAGSLR